MADFLNDVSERCDEDSAAVVELCSDAVKLLEVVHVTGESRGSLQAFGHRHAVARSTIRPGHEGDSRYA